MIPAFIQTELYGPYGYDTLKKLGQIERLYHIYEHGAEFQCDHTDGFTPAKLQSNQVKKLIKKQAQFLFGKTPEHKISCPDEPVTKDNGKVNESDMQDYVNAVLKANLWSDKLIKGAKDCFIGGRVAIKANIDKDNIGLLFVPADSFVFETDLDDVDKLNKIVFFYTLKDDEERECQRIWVQKYRMENGACLLSERITDGNGKPVEVRHEDYNTGLGRIPAYVIINDGLSGETDGESDVETIQSEDSWYSKMRSANLDSLRKSMNQIIWMSGVEPKCFEKFTTAPGSIWDVEGDISQAGDTNQANVQVGTISNDFNYATAYADTLSNLKQSMGDALGVPDLDLESTKSLITSGKGLKALYWPLICRCEEKMNVWRPALEWLTELILYAAEVFPSLRKVYGDFKPALHIVIIDNQYPLPEDEDEERTLDMQEVNTQTRSRKSYLMKWGGNAHKGLSAEEADEELKQIALERQLLEDSYEGMIEDVEEDDTGGDE